MSRSLLIPLVGTVLAAAPAAQLIQVPPGGDLVAAVAAAPDGAVLELQGPGPYVGTLSWSQRALTVRAAAGVSPTIVGDPDDHAVDLAATNPPTVATFEGVRLEKGAGPPSSIARAAFLLGEGPGDPVLDVTFRGCELVGVLHALTIGTADADLTLEGSGVSELVELYTSWDATLDATLTGCRLDDALRVIGREDSSTTAVVEDCSIGGGALVGTNEEPTLACTLRRCEVLWGLHAFSVSDGVGTVDFLAESCLVRQGSGEEPSITATNVHGVTAFADNAGLDARFVNLTIAGFDLGYDAPVGATGENLLFHRNVVDLAPSSASSVWNSLIPDGTATSWHGNFQAVAVLDGAFALVDGSPGVDAGNAAAVGLGNLDLGGDPRVQDGDLDGVAAVSVGARETPSCAPALAAAESVRAGAPANPVALLPGDTPPTSGATWDPAVDHASFLPVATVDLLAVCAAPASAFLPGSGTLLVDPSTLLAWQVVAASSPFAVEVPAACDFVGATVHAQVLSFGPSGAARLTNALDVTVGVL